MNVHKKNRLTGSVEFEICCRQAVGPVIMHILTYSLTHTWKRLHDPRQAITVGKIKTMYRSRIGLIQEADLWL